MGNIKHNNYRNFDCRIINDTNLDFILMKHKPEIFTFNSNEIALLKFNNIKDKHVVSNAVWDNAITSSELLENIGYTGVDNGFISYEKDRISNEDFLNIFTNSSFDLSTFDDKFFITEVTGNTALYSYPIEKHNDYVSLKGGFYQGFFKIEGKNYQTLPHIIEDEWNFNFILRKQNYQTPSNILNKRYSNNEGFFFYIGTRSENKFWELYKKQNTVENYKIEDSEEYFEDDNFIKNNVTKYSFFQKEETKDDNNYKDNDIDNDYFEGDYNPYDDEVIDYSDYFNGEYNPYKEDSNEDVEVGDCIYGDYAVESDYFEKQISLDDIELKDTNDKLLSETGFYEIKTDNKFIIFNQTKNGFTKNTWNDEYQFSITGQTKYPNLNYFPYLNQTKTGYTKDNISKLNDEHAYAYNIFKDIENNAFGLKINNDGSLTYRFLTNKSELIEETSKPNLITENEWTSIHLKLKKNSKQECNTDNNSKMRLYIYVNGYLKFVSKEIPELILKPLKDASERQEGVPYNISIGGGSQGLSERIMTDYYDNIKYQFPIEKYFAGTFIGDIKEFSFISEPIDFNTIYKKGCGF